MLPPLALLKMVPMKVWAGLALAAVVVLYSWWLISIGRGQVQADWDEENLRLELARQIDAVERKEVTTKVETVYVDRIQKVFVQGETIVKEVPIYVPLDTPDLPGGWRLLHDAAVYNRIPDATGLPDAAPVSAQTAAATVAENYTACNANIEVIHGAQRWVTEQLAKNKK